MSGSGAGRIMFISLGSLVALFVAGTPLLAGADYGLTVRAEATDGVAEYRLDCSEGRCLDADGDLRWKLEGPVALRDAESGKTIGWLESASLEAAGQTVVLNFLVDILYTYLDPRVRR